MADVIGVIQGRMGSTRLPGKLLAPIAGRPMLEVLVERLRPARVNSWWLATTTEPDDDVTAAWGAALGLEVVRGDRDDVLSRFATIVERCHPAWVVRVTADDPFTDAGVVDALVQASATATAEIDHIAEPAERSLPLGYTPELVRGTAIMDAATADLPAHHRAHVTSWLRDSGRSAPFPIPSGWPPRPSWRWTVDTSDDLAMADASFQAFGGASATIDYPAMVRILDDRPEIPAQNAHVSQKRVLDG
jgi:spore coat polysaccharide biosynthesis protein SpsF